MVLVSREMRAVRIRGRNSLGLFAWKRRNKERAREEKREVNRGSSIDRTGE